MTSKANTQQFNFGKRTLANPLPASTLTDPVGVPLSGIFDGQVYAQGNL